MAEDELKIQRVSVHCATTAVGKHGPELCDDYAALRLHVYGWKCECECHDREETE